MKKPTSRETFPLCCRLSIQSGLIDTFNRILQEGWDIKNMGFVPDELRKIADQFEDLIKRETT